MRCIVFALLAVSASAENFSKPLNNEKQQSIEFNERNTTILSAEFVEHVQRALGWDNIYYIFLTSQFFQALCKYKSIMLISKKNCPIPKSL